MRMTKLLITAAVAALTLAAAGADAASRMHTIAQRGGWLASASDSGRPQCSMSARGGDDRTVHINYNRHDGLFMLMKRPGWSMRQHVRMSVDISIDDTHEPLGTFEAIGYGSTVSIIF